MKTTKTITATAITALLILAGCSVETDTQATPAPSPTQEVEEVQEDPEPEPTEEIDITEVEPEPEPLEPGDIVAEEDVEAAREAGATIYVSPNGGGTGLVIDPEATELPEPVRQELEALPSHPGGTREEQAQINLDQMAHGEAMEEAGLVAFQVVRTGTWDGDELVEVSGYQLLPLGLGDEAREFARDNRIPPQPSPEAAIAAKSELIDRYPDAPIIDMT